MTGYGRGEAKDQTGVVVAEVRSVNNRYLDVQVKTPRSLAVLEPRIRKAVQERCARGRVDVFISRSGGDANPFRLSVDHGLAGQYLGILRELKERYALPGEVGLSELLAVPEIVTREEIAEDIESVWALTSRALDDALHGLLAMRRQEGAALGKDIDARLRTIGAMAEAVRRRAPVTVEQAQRRMTDTVARILQEQPDPARIAQEIAIVAERTDVTEELTRLESHLAQFRTMLDASGGEPVGRKLDFLIQELGREVNTIASKSMDAEISLTMVNAKAELEKVREQVQNIE
jgi:uncharacterized protein (TIGR00255 family)